MTQTYAWCFDRDVMHRFAGSPWCIARWVAFAAADGWAALAAKEDAYGDAQFLHDLPAEQQLEVIDIAAARR